MRNVDQLTTVIELKMFCWLLLLLFCGNLKQILFMSCTVIFKYKISLVSSHQGFDRGAFNIRLKFVIAFVGTDNKFFFNKSK